MKNPIPTVLLLALCLTSAGCKNRLVFVTQTSLGLDVSGTASYPNRVSFSYNRYEGAIVPRKRDGSNESHSVFGGTDSDVRFAIPPKYRIDQVFATGKAAWSAANRVSEAPEKAADATGDGMRDASEGGRTTSRSRASKRDGASERRFTVKPEAPLVFMTGTTLGIHLTAGEQEINPTALIGYRRSEATVIPIFDPKREVRSVYADIHISGGETDAVDGSGPNTDAAKRKAMAEEKHVSQWGGVRIQQSFATGEAAETLAKYNREIQAKLQRAARVVEIKHADADRIAEYAAPNGTVDRAKLEALTKDTKLGQRREWLEEWAGKPKAAFLAALKEDYYALIPALAKNLPKP